MNGHGSEGKTCKTLEMCRNNDIFQPPSLVWICPGLMSNLGPFAPYCAHYHNATFITEVNYYIQTQGTCRCLVDGDRGYGRRMRGQLANEWEFRQLPLHYWAVARGWQHKAVRRRHHLRNQSPSWIFSYILPSPLPLNGWSGKPSVGSITLEFKKNALNLRQNQVCSLKREAREEMIRRDLFVPRFLHSPGKWQRQSERPESSLCSSSTFHRHSSPSQDSTPLRNHLTSRRKSCCRPHTRRKSLHSSRTIPGCRRTAEKGSHSHFHESKIVTSKWVINLYNQLFRV